jgi:drug/metabolite transporter (DMT)-like permease
MNNLTLPLGEIAALVTALFFSFTALFFSFSGRRLGSNVVNRSRLLLALFFLSVFHLFIEGSIFPFQAEPFRWFWLGLSSLFGLILGDTFLFYGYATIGARLSMLMMALAPILSVIAGRVLFNEQLNNTEMAGIALTIGGISWVVTGRRTGREADIAPRYYALGLLAALGGAVGQASGLITARYGLVDNFPTISATIMRIFVAVVVLWGLTVFRGQVRATFRSWRDRPALRAMVGGTLVGPVLGIWFSLMAISLAPLGIASTLMALPPVLLIPINYLLFRETATWRSVAGTIVAFAGVAFIFLGG